jgi:hypothetical protein
VVFAIMALAYLGAAVLVLPIHVEERTAEVRAEEQADISQASLLG